MRFDVYLPSLSLLWLDVFTLSVRRFLPERMCSVAMCCAHEIRLHGFHSFVFASARYWALCKAVEPNPLLLDPGRKY